MKDIFYEAIKDSRKTIFAEFQKYNTTRLHFHRAFELLYIIEGQAVCDKEISYIMQKMRLCQALFQTVKK